MKWRPLLPGHRELCAPRIGTTAWKARDGTRVSGIGVVIPSNTCEAMFVAMILEAGPRSRKELAYLEEGEDAAIRLVERTFAKRPRFATFGREF